MYVIHRYRFIIVPHYEQGGSAAAKISKEPVHRFV